MNRLSIIRASPLWRDRLKPLMENHRWPTLSDYGVHWPVEDVAGIYWK